MEVWQLALQWSMPLLVVVLLLNVFMVITGAMLIHPPAMYMGTVLAVVSFIGIVLVGAHGEVRPEEPSPYRLSNGFVVLHHWSDGGERHVRPETIESYRATRYGSALKRRGCQEGFFETCEMDVRETPAQLEAVLGTSSASEEEADGR